MKMRPEEIEKIAGMIIRTMKSEGEVVFKADESRLRLEIAAVIVKNLEDEDAIDKEARRLMELHKREMQAGLDVERAYMMIKRQIAKERKFVL